MRDERRKKRRRKSLYRLKTALLSPIGIVGFACWKGRDRILFVPVVTPLRLACAQERGGEVSLAGIFALPPQPSANFEFSGSVFFGLGWGRRRSGRRSDSLLGRFQLSGERKRRIRRTRKGSRERGREGGGELFFRPRANFFFCSLLLLRSHFQTAVEEGAASQPV